VRAVGRACDRAHDDPLERARYKLHPEVLALAEASHVAGDHGSLVRVDLLLGEDGSWRACEINADCPAGTTSARLRASRARRGSSRARTHAGRRARGGAPVRARRARGRAGAVALLFATAYAEDCRCARSSSAPSTPAASARSSRLPRRRASWTATSS